MGLSDHAVRNKAEWEKIAPEYEENGRLCWSGEKPPSWGIWGVVESDVRALPDVAGKDIVELGCGTAYWSAWLARMGAKPVGVDITDAQLANARKFMAEYGPEFPLVQASAEDVPLPDASFDVAFSEYGASIWCDPYLWIPEAARLLRPGGELIFLVNGTISMLCSPEDDSKVTDRLVHDYFGMHRWEWPEDNSVDFHIGYGDWIRLLRANEFMVEDLIEIRAPDDAPESRYSWADKQWARRWPSEEIWKARKL
jgi:ubiquinone/menaquinone biosynthesis C-methylase UbiE